MEININAGIKKLNFKYNYLDKNSVLIPYKTFNKYTCYPETKEILFCDFNNGIYNLYKKLSFDDNIYSLSKISLNNKEYLFISKNKKNKLYLIEENYKNLKEEIFGSEKFENDIFEKLEVLDNNNIVAKADIKLAYYEKKNNLIYQKFFNNLNKFDTVLGICKLSNNGFFFISSSHTKIIFVLFNEDFTSIEKEIELRRPLENIKNNIMFKYNNDKVIIIHKNGFIIFDVKSYEINTIFNTGLVCGVLPFNSKLNEINKDYCKYLALIIYENKQFFLKIINLDNNIEETEKINLAEYSSEFEALIDDNNILDIYGKNEKENENIKEEKVEKFDLFFHIGQRFQNVETKKVFLI